MHLSPEPQGTRVSTPQVTAPRIEWPAESPSTNDALAADLTAGGDWPDFSVYGTAHQTAGHGRLDRVWDTPAHTCLTFSVPVRVPADYPVDRIGWLPLVTGGAVTAALRELGVDAGLKWPNDVLVSGRKICGILVRALPLERPAPEAPAGRVPAAGSGAVASGAVPSTLTAVIGIGLNHLLSTEQLPVPTATSVALCGVDVDRDTLLDTVLRHLRAEIGQALAAGQTVARSAVVERLSTHMITLGSEVAVDLPGGEVLRGTATGLDDSAALLVDDGRAVHTVGAGDVVHARTVRAQAATVEAPASTVESVSEPGSESASGSPRATR
ncbi:biotin--[acetyl-CoA-carboxylase] ligase [Brevibacterium litoralis]|uniref:biotin--[acetyl-CoA-carboxylase] ligase n=1 Tax=Brevibacterium litoralis TaxID=3138935 RepID=UPI0032EF08C2